MKNVNQPLAKIILILLRLTAAASVADPGYIRKILGSRFTTLIISNEEMEDIIKIIRSFEDSGLLLKEVRETIKSKAK